VSVGWCNTYEGRKVNRVAMCEVRSRKNGQEQKKKKEKKSTVVSSKKKSTVMSPIGCRMKKCNPSSGQNGQVVHWWLLIHSGPFPCLQRKKWFKKKKEQLISSDYYDAFEPATIKTGNAPWSSQKNELTVERKYPGNPSTESTRHVEASVNTRKENQNNQNSSNELEGLMP